MNNIETPGPYTSTVVVPPEDEETISEQIERGKLRRIVAKVGATAAAATAALTLIGGKAYSGDSLHLPKAAIEYTHVDE